MDVFTSVKCPKRPNFLGAITVGNELRPTF